MIYSMYVYVVVSCNLICHYPLDGIKKHLLPNRGFTGRGREKTEMWTNNPRYRLTFVCVISKRHLTWSLWGPALRRNENALQLAYTIRWLDTWHESVGK